MEKYNDDSEGYIYCIDTHLRVEDSNSPMFGQRLVKLGRTGTRKNIEEYLLHRYAGQYPDCSVIFYERVSNNIEAERVVFQLLDGLYYKYEHFIRDIGAIEKEFGKVAGEFESIDKKICRMTPEELTELNVQNRVQSKER